MQSPTRDQDGACPPVMWSASSRRTTQTGPQHQAGTVTRTHGSELAPVLPRCVACAAAEAPNNRCRRLPYSLRSYVAAASGSS